MQEGLKELVVYCNELAKPNFENYGSNHYVDKDMKRLDANVRAASLEMTTLTSLIDYIKAEIDQSTIKMIIHVVSPTTVKLISELDSDRKREILVTVNADIPSFKYGEYFGHEQFIIALQSKFIENEDRALLLKFAGTVESGTVKAYGDDGVSQKATVKTGVSAKGDAIIPNPVSLIPYRTFLEIEQPESNFIFRMKENERSGSVECAIFEADGGAWSIDAMKYIKEYLEVELSEFPDYTVIS
ncbi:MAG: hypothetical protein ACERKN_07255 [Velocimicrobium sp.]